MNAKLNTAETTTSICIGIGGMLARHTANSSKSGMRHLHWSGNEKKNIHFVTFPTRIRHLCRKQTHLNYSYI